MGLINNQISPLNYVKDWLRKKKKQDTLLKSFRKEIQYLLAEMDYVLKDIEFEET